MLRFYFFIFSLVGQVAFSQQAASSAALQTPNPPVENTLAVINRSIDQHNSSQYKSAIKTLLSVKNNREQFPIWYYYYGLNLARIQRYDLALKSFQIFIKKSQVSKTAKAYYYTGLIQFQQRQYDQAINSLQLALDVSRDPKLDVSIDNMVDKAIRYQNYYENSKRTHLSFLLGYAYDTNTINLARSAFDVDLAGHVLNYGVSLAHKFVDQYSFVFEPNVAVLDSYTLDSRFKGNSTLQSSDALQLLLSLPVKFFFENEKNPSQYNLSLNAYSVYLPITSTKRELSISSVYLKGDVMIPLGGAYSLRNALTVASDKSVGHSSDEDDASGLRVEFLSSLYQSLSDRGNSVYYKAGADVANTKGINTRYKKYKVGLGYVWPSWGETVSNVGLDYSHLSYSDRTVKRSDNQYSLAYAVSKSFASASSLGLLLEAVQNSSNSDLNKYNDYNIGLQYSKSFGF